MSFPMEFFDKETLAELFSKFPQWAPGPKALHAVGFAPPDLRVEMRRLTSLEALVRLIKFWQRFCLVRQRIAWRGDDFRAAAAAHPRYFGTDMYKWTKDDAIGLAEYQSQCAEVIDEVVSQCLDLIDTGCDQVIVSPRELVFNHSLASWWFTVPSAFELNAVCREILRTRLERRLEARLGAIRTDSEKISGEITAEIINDFVDGFNLSLDFVKRGRNPVVVFTNNLDPHCLVRLVQGNVICREVFGYVTEYHGFSEFSLIPERASYPELICRDLLLSREGGAPPLEALLLHDGRGRGAIVKCNYIKDLPVEVRSFAWLLTEPEFMTRMGLLATRWSGDFLPLYVARNFKFWISPRGRSLCAHRTSQFSEALRHVSQVSNQA